jgi:hypothetical protein
VCVCVCMCVCVCVCVSWILGSGAEIGCSEERDHRPGFKHEKRLPECCAGVTIYKYDNVVSNDIR